MYTGNETVAGDGGDTGLHVMCVCWLFVYVTQFLTKQKNHLLFLNDPLFRFGPPTFDRLHGQHVGAGITHGGGPPLAVAPRLHGITFLFGW